VSFPPRRLPAGQGIARVAVSLATLVLASGAEALGQGTQGESVTSVQWDLEAVQSGWCLEFLMQPDASNRDLPRGLTAAPASGVPGLHPALAGLVENQPAFQGWTPAELCTVVAGRLVAGDRQFERGDGGGPLILVWWVVSAVHQDGPANAVRYLGTNSTRLNRAMKASFLDLERVKAKLEPVPDSEDRRLRLELERAVLFFDIHVTPDTLPVDRDHRWHWVVPGARNVLWSADASAAPEASGGVAGALRIQGKRGLAAILAHSPVRIFGPGFTGGSFTLRLTH
jgi:hypothetical protein